MWGCALKLEWRIEEEIEVENGVEIAGHMMKALDVMFAEDLTFTSDLENAEGMGWMGVGVQIAESDVKIGVKTE